MSNTPRLITTSIEHHVMQQAPRRAPRGAEHGGEYRGEHGLSITRRGIMR